MDDIFSDVVRISPVRQNYMQQKRILQQVYGAYKNNAVRGMIPSISRRVEAVGLSVDSGRVNNIRQII